jgi:hypothetical protein
LGRKKSRFAAAFLFSAGITYRLVLVLQLAAGAAPVAGAAQVLHQQERLQVLVQQQVLELALLLLFCRKQLK